MKLQLSWVTQQVNSQTKTKMPLLQYSFLWFTLVLSVITQLQENTIILGKSCMQFRKKQNPKLAQSCPWHILDFSSWSSPFSNSLNSIIRSLISTVSFTLLYLRNFSLKTRDAAIKRNKIELFVVRWMDLESVIQSEVSQKEKNKYRMLTHIYGI